MTQIPEKIQEDYLKLVDKLTRWEQAYFLNDTPDVSDAEYDENYKALLAMEKAYPGIKVPGSPSERVGGGIQEGFDKAEHPVPLMSLGNIFDRNELDQFVSRIEKELDSQPTFFGEVKFDGLSIALYYSEGQLEKAVTRGDGRVGEVVTQNVKTIRSVPLVLKKPVNLVVRAEIVMEKKEFALLNERQQESGGKIFANPRNAAAGSIRQLDVSVAASRKLQAYCYDILDSSETFQTQSEMNSFLKEMGFRTDPTAQEFKTVEEMEEFRILIEGKRHNLDYDIDGVVLKLNDVSPREEIGFTGKAPRWAMAYKFKAEQAETVVESVRVQVGRTGVLTPVAEFQPVKLAGSTVRNASLHNWEEIDSLDVRIGDHVLIQKAGDIIPQVVRVLKEKRPSHAEIIPVPSVCPVCQSEVKRNEGEVAFRCSNPACPSRKLAWFCHFVSRDALNIQGMGKAVLEQLLDLELVDLPMDLFSLEQEQFLKLENTKEKLAEKYYQAIQERRQIPLERYIFSLGIPQVGLQTARQLAEIYSLNELHDAEVEELQKVEGIGEKTAQFISDFFKSQVFEKLEKKRIDSGVELIVPEILTVDGALSGETVCFTGTLSVMKRKDAQDFAAGLGAQISTSVSGKTTILVCGEKAGSKREKAEKLGIRILSEDEFFSIYQEG